MAFEKPARHVLMDPLFILRVWRDGATAEETWPCGPGQQMALHKQLAQNTGWKIDFARSAQPLTERDQQKQQGPDQAMPVDRPEHAWPAANSIAGPEASRPALASAWGSGLRRGPLRGWLATECAAQPLVALGI